MDLAEPIAAAGTAQELAVSIVMPCLNEVQSLPHCIANATEALARIAARYGFSGEIVIADNGSTDGSQALATSLGARVVNVAAKGYGAALIGGFDGAYGRFLVMGDADGSYDFTESVAMIGRLLDGADMCMGSRFKGGIKPGAMPWKNRYIGNPALTGILNLFFRAGVDDAHCGLRAIRRESYEALALEGSGMEFASEMVIKASLRRMRIDEVPATLSPDLRDRAPHLRPWRDGWRHLRYLLMLSPTWAFGVPAALLMGLGAMILCYAAFYAVGIWHGEPRFGVSWTIVATFMITTGHFAAIMALATHFYGVRRGFRPMRPLLRKLEPALTLENALIAGGGAMLASLLSLAAIGYWWSANNFAALPNTLPLLVAIGLGVVGMQTALGGFLLAVIAGHEARFARGGPERSAYSALRASAAA
jgi:glycosyltransferase involved in cell wall biosynthesis